MTTSNAPHAIATTPALSARPQAPAETLAEARQRTGKALIIGGSCVTVVGVVLYCLVCFAGGMDADLGDILFKNTVPFARGTLAVLGLGTVVWLIGSFTYLKGAMEADEGPGRG